MADFSTVTTADGRVLEYLVSGPPDGKTLLFQPGTPSAGMLLSAVVEPAEQLGLRVVSYSRPGYGQSTPRPGRGVADAVTDIETVLDAVGVERFVTLGWSGGGPHALATGALLPERCQAVAVLAGPAPYPAYGIDWFAGMDSGNVEEFGAALAGKDELTALLETFAAELGGVTGEGVTEGLGDLLSPVDRAALTGEFAEEMAAGLRRAVSNGIAGWRDDDLAFVSYWGFDLAGISVPVAVWQGRQDRMVPFEHGQWLAAKVPNAQAHLFATEGHLSMVSRFGEIFADLLELADRPR
ncbi:alpha/beta fold hydrolase [Jatrophihabitans sp.]|uniref:alpha/beta fold hydrolase n=1 Tax=Jatrophihabitans sp. TaxID=1932789 RepID=UPI002D0D4B75|nr:alpha/beta hydrolase [Jatrophihabitans sp.]